ncbi:thiamine pyrophosphate-dependent enzyme [Pseudomonas sp. PWP3-1b2]|uniref:thiamine pyrophosphate-dependent enzyme n=1 Tax=Pseudomonas TaxID=286 RepID=UPI003CE99F1E
MKFTGSQIVAKALKANGVDYVAGMPGDGAWALVESLLAPGTDIPFIHVMQEHSGVHLADGYFRACGRPMAVVLAGPLRRSKAMGAVAVAQAQASALLVISGVHDDTAIMTIEQLPQALRQAFETMLSDRAPVNLAIDVTVQAATLQTRLPPASLRAEQPPLVPTNIAVLRQARVSRSVLEADAIVVVGAGGVQARVGELFPNHHPASHLGAETLGWAVPAAIGARLAMPARQVVCAVGSADFLQSMQEMAVCVMHSIPVVFLVFNGTGEFNLPDGKPYAPDFAGIARNFGLEAWRVEHASHFNQTFTKALNSTGPSLVEVMPAARAPQS